MKLEHDEALIILCGVTSCMAVDAMAAPANTVPPESTHEIKEKSTVVEFNEIIWPTNVGPMADPREPTPPIIAVTVPAAFTFPGNKSIY